MSKSEMAAIAMPKKKSKTAIADKKKSAKKTRELVAAAVRKSKKNKG